MSFHPVHLILILAALLVVAMMRAAHHGKRLKELARNRAEEQQALTIAERIADIEREIALARGRGHA